MKTDGFGSLSGFLSEFIMNSATICLYDKILTRENDQNTKDIYSINDVICLDRQNFVGSASKSWKNKYITNTSLYLSDVVMTSSSLIDIIQISVSQVIDFLLWGVKIS